MSWEVGNLVIYSSFRQFPRLPKLPKLPYKSDLFFKKMKCGPYRAPSGILQRFDFVYLLTLISSKPSSFSNNCTLACSYILQSSKKCLTVSGWPHKQAGVIDNPIEYKCEFRFDLFNLNWVCRELGNLNPELKCLNFGGFSISLSLALKSVWSSPFNPISSSSHNLIVIGKKDFSKKVFCLL